MVDHADELGTALSSEPMGVAGVLFDKNLIKNEVLQKMMKVDTPRARGDVLVQAVINLIAAAPEKLKSFLKLSQISHGVEKLQASSILPIKVSQSLQILLLLSPGWPWSLCIYY